MKRAIIISLATFILGPLPFILFSIQTNTLLPANNVDFPFVFIWTMSIGDTILLPIINAKIGLLFFDKLSTVEKNKNVRFLWILASMIFILSFFFNSITHYSWAMDNFSDFMGLLPGDMTIGGWWHYIFSILEMFLIGFFYILWHVAIKENNTTALTFIKKSWWWIFAFSTLMIANFFQQYFTVYNEPFLEALKAAKFTFLPLIATVALRLMFFYLEKHSKKTNLLSPPLAY